MLRSLRSICDEYVCLSSGSHMAYLRNHMDELQILCMCCLWPWHGVARSSCDGVAIRYVCLRFCGCRHVFTQQSITNPSNGGVAQASTAVVFTISRKQLYRLYVMRIFIVGLPHVIQAYYILLARGVNKRCVSMLPNAVQPQVNVELVALTVRRHRVNKQWCRVKMRWPRAGLNSWWSLCQRPSGGGF